MCTVTYIPDEKGFILSSSRDEKFYRPSLQPATYEHFGHQIIYPKDEKAGGTWIALSEQHQIACLLNGAYENHQKQQKYRQSRGQVLLESFNDGYVDPSDFAGKVILTGIEPFTLLLLSKGAFHELRWDGNRKNFTAIDMGRPAIWSSATLYEPNMQKQREKWFFDWLKTNALIADYNIQGFHYSRHGHDGENDIIMKRSSGIQTLSISQIRYQDNKSSFRYFDLQSMETSNLELAKLVGV